MKHKSSLISIALATIMLVSLCAVCASTSVTAAAVDNSNNKAPAQAPSLVGAPAGVVGAPAVCSHAANSLDLFIRGTDNAIWWRNWTNGVGWSTLTSLCGIVTSSPAASSPYAGILNVAAPGTDGALWYIISLDGGSTWGSWDSLGVNILAGTGPTVFSPSSATVNFAVIGTDSALWWWTGYSWQSIGGYLTSSPSATSPATNELAIAARGGDGALWYIVSNNGGSTWGSWHSLGGKIIAGTGTGVVYDGTAIRYFVIGTDSALWWRTTMQDWTSLGGYLT